MKKFISSVLVLTMILALLVGCRSAQVEGPAVPTADPTTVLTTEPTQNTTEEVEDEIKNVAEQYQMEVEKVKEAVNVDSVKNDLASRKAVKLIVDSAVAVKPKKAPAKKSTAKKTTTKKTTTKKAAEAAESEAPAEKETATEE